MPRQIPRAVLLPVYKRRDDPIHAIQLHAPNSGQMERRDVRPEIPTPNHDRNSDRPLHISSRVPSCPSEDARYAGEQPACREYCPNVSYPGARRREEDAIAGERRERSDEDERAACPETVGEYASDNGGDASCGVGRDREELSS